MNDPNDPDLKDEYGETISDWCTTGLKDFSWLFWHCTDFNEPLNGWDLSSATNTAHMFHGATAFNQPLPDWEVGKVQVASLMFYDATSFTGSGLGRWDISSLQDARYMFKGASSFSQSLCSWGVEMKTNTIVNGMFENTKCVDTGDPDLDKDKAGPFCQECFSCFTTNSELREAVKSYAKDGSKDSTVAKRYGYPISTWCTGLVDDFSLIFNGLTNFNEPLNGWDVSRAKTLSGMFFNARSFNQVSVSYVQCTEVDCDAFDALLSCRIVLL